MFTLIIDFLSVAIVAALALATLYYGGSAFNTRSGAAEAARLINEGQQANGGVSGWYQAFGSRKDRRWR